MRLSSKRGAALAIVIVVSAALLILAAALVSAAQFNLSYAQNSLESRQAYLNAKSAIEYGKAYVTKNPTTGDFTVNGSSSWGFTIVKVSDATKVTFDANVVASYVSVTKLLKAAGKYKSSDRFRKLGYQFSTESGGGSISNFVACGFQYGDTKMFNSGYMFGNFTLNYPMLANRTGSAPDFQSSVQSSAPRMYFMSTNSSGACISAHHSGCSAGLISDFFSFNGNITADDSNISLILKSKSSGVGIAYFNHTQILVNGKNKIKTSDPNAMLNGYYKFTSPLNLFTGDVGNKLTSIDGSVDATLKNDNDYILDNYDNIISGDKISVDSNNHNGVGWTVDGKISEGKPSDQADYIVFLYATSCSNWTNGDNFKSTFSYDNGSKVCSDANVYGANEIYFQYVNNSGNFIVPYDQNRQKEKPPFVPCVLCLKANFIALNTQVSDTDSGTIDTRPRIVGEKGAKFFLVPKDGAKDFYLTCQSALKIFYSDEKGYQYSYIIAAGTYHITTGINLFTKDAQDYFASTSPISTGSTGGSGGATTTGGTYTNG